MRRKRTPEQISTAVAAGARKRWAETPADERKAATAAATAASPATKKKPTPCARCGEVQPSARAAWVHCRDPRRREATQIKPAG